MAICPLIWLGIGALWDSKCNSSIATDNEEDVGTGHARMCERVMAFVNDVYGINPANRAPSFTTVAIVTCTTGGDRVSHGAERGGATR